MKDAYRERMGNMASLVRKASSSGVWEGGYLSMFDELDMEEQAELLLKAGLKGIARQETEAIGKETDGGEGLRLEKGVRHLIIEGMFRVIDDRRNDPDYLARLSPEDRQALEDPFADIRSGLEEQADEMRTVSQGWGESGESAAAR